MYVFDATALQKQLKIIMGELYDVFNYLLIKFDAVIAEDCVADSFVSNPIKHIKIYVDIARAEDFMDIMYNIKYFRQEITITNEIHLMYLSSFNSSQSGDIVKLTIICTNNPLDKIKNHYLTCCQSWYNGTIIRSTNKEIADKISYINKEYIINTCITLLESGDPFINDYYPIGYKLYPKSFDIPVVEAEDNIEKEIVSNLYCDIINREILITKKVYFIDSFINSSDDQKKREFKAYKYLLKEFTLDHLLSVFDLHSNNKYFIIEYIINEITSADDDINYFDEDKDNSNEYLEWLQNYFVKLTKPESRKKLQFKV